MIPLKNTANLQQQTHGLYALFHFITKVQQFANPRLLIRVAVVEF